MIEKGLGGGEHRRFAGHIAIANDTDPLALQQRLDDMAVDRHATHIFDLATGDRLAVGNQRHGFEHGAGIALRPLLPQAPDPWRELLADLQAITGRHFLEFEGPPLAGFAQQRQGLLEYGRLRSLAFFKEFEQALHRLRLSRGQQESFKQGGQLAGFSQIH